MSSPFHRDNWDRPPGRDDNRDRNQRNRVRAQGQRQQPEYIYEEDEYENDQEHDHDHDHHHHYHEHDDDRNQQDEDVRRYTHRGHRHDDQFLEREREYPDRREFIPDRSRRMGSLLGIFESPGQEQVQPIRRPRVEYERDYYPQEQERRINERMPMLIPVPRVSPPLIDQERQSIDERMPKLPVRPFQEQERRSADSRIMTPQKGSLPQEQERRSVDSRIMTAQKGSLPHEQDRSSTDERISLQAGRPSLVREQGRININERESLIASTPTPPPVDIPIEPQRSSFEYRQREDVSLSERENGKERERGSKEIERSSIIESVKLSEDIEREAEPTEKDALLGAEVKKEISPSSIRQKREERLSKDESIRKGSVKSGRLSKDESIRRGSSKSERSREGSIGRSASELKKRSSISKRLSTSQQRPSTNSYLILKEEDEDEGFPIKENGSILLPVLEDSEKIFHELVASGDVIAVSEFLESHQDFNINCVNYQKMSALHVAVYEQDEEMVKFLLSQKSLDVFDCVLHAVKLGNIKIVESILDRIKETSPGLEDAVVTHSVDFPDDMTPLILAAQLGDYEMIDFLIKRDHKIPPVHHPYCKCETCKSELKKYDRLRYSTKKLDLYKAISNPMYIFHVTDDPILRAFDLAKELQDASKVFPQFYVSYEELWKELRNFSVDLISCCRNTKEVEIVLNKPSGPVAGQVKFPRLQYAIDLKQKEFVSHAYTQAVLGGAWTEGLLDWQIRSPFMQFLSVFPRIIMLPFMTFMCIFMPNHSLVAKWRIPVNRMISSCASYLIFLVLLLIESNLDKSNQKRGPPKSGLEWIIVLYVLGYIWDNIRLCFKTGAKRYFTYMWHWFDCIMLTLFVITFLSWLASWADVKAYDEADLPRKYWNPTDPLLIAEGFFAVAVVMAFFRLFRILSLNYYLGPFQVSIGKMTLDIGKFIIIYFILLLSWTAGFSKFYQPYRGMIQKDEASGTTVAQVDSFVSFGMTLKTYFWSIFGMSPIESADVIIENLPGDTPDKPIKNHHDFTEFVGYVGFTAFQFLSAVVVLNMLIACMANTFTKVTDNISVEWIFGRSQVYLSYMAASTLPPPFNLIPTASGFKTMFTWFKLLAKPHNGQRAKCNMTHCCFIENEVEPYINSEFPSLMSELAQRYLRLKEKEKDGTSNQDVVDVVRTELNELREILRRMEEKILEKT